MPKFNVKMRGYDSSQVDKYVENTIDKIKKLQAENKRLAESNESDDQKSKEISRAMIYAQKSSDRIQEQAQKQAKAVVDKADAKAEKKINDAQKNANDLASNAKAKYEKLTKQNHDLLTVQFCVKSHIKDFLHKELKAVDKPTQKPERGNNHSSKSKDEKSASKKVDSKND